MRAQMSGIRKDPPIHDWVLYEMAEKNILSFVASGNGGVTELIPYLKNNVPAYGLVRLTEKYDESAVVKFVFIDWLPTETPMMQKAGLGVIRGQILKFFDPSHAQISTDTREDLAHERLVDLISEQTGTKSKVRERDLDREDVLIVNQQVVGKDKAKTFAPIKSGGQLKFPDESGCYAAINDVRDKNTVTNWVLFGYVKGSSNQIELIGSGSGGLFEMTSKIMNDGVYYGLYRMVDRIDDSDTVKYATFYFLGEQTPIMHKARIGTHRGEVETFLGQSHVAISTSDMGDMTEVVVHDKIGTTSGSKSRVKNA